MSLSPMMTLTGSPGLGTSMGTVSELLLLTWLTTTADRLQTNQSISVQNTIVCIYDTQKKNKMEAIKGRKTILGPT